MSRHAADSNYDFHFPPIRGEHWDFKPPNASTDSGQNDGSNASDASDDKEDGNASSSSGSSSSSSSHSSDGNNTDADAGDDKTEDVVNNNQDVTASPDAAPTDAAEFPNNEPAVSQDLADYIDKHDRVLEESRRDFEWTEASFFGENGGIELQHDTLHEKILYLGATQKRRSSVGMIPSLPPRRPNQMIPSAQPERTSSQTKTLLLKSPPSFPQATLLKRQYPPGNTLSNWRRAPGGQVIPSEDLLRKGIAFFVICL